MAKIVINKKNYFHNLSQITNHIKDKSKIAVVIKDNAYGHGLIEISSLAKEFGINRAVVKNIKEAKIVDKYFDYIIILSSKNIDTYSHKFHITINSKDDIYNVPKNSNIHIKIDTGMHRNGIDMNEIRDTIITALKLKLNITGIYTHHRSADELSSEYFYQKNYFKDTKIYIKKICEELFLSLPEFHSVNSSALFRTKNFDEDIARVGIASYGYIETNRIFELPNLKPVMSLYASKISSRKLDINQKIGYAGAFKAESKIDVSTYDIGYGDGFFRIDETKNYKSEDGYRLLGRVSMDYTSFQTTKDEICIFKDARILAKLHNTITYEILTSLKENILREIK